MRKEMGIAQKRTKGLAVYLAQPKNRRFAGLGYKSPIEFRTNGLAVSGPESHCRPTSGGDLLICVKTMTNPTQQS